MINSLLLFFAFSFISLFADVEYDIVLLDSEEFTTEGLYWDKYFIGINEAGYVFGTHFGIYWDFDGENEFSWDVLVPYVYHQKIGFKKIVLPQNNEIIGNFDGVKSVNNQGIAVGAYGGNVADDYGCIHPSIFVFDTASEKCYDLLDDFGIKNTFQDCYVNNLCITDNNRVIFNVNDSIYIYDLNQRSVSLLKNEALRSVNSKGQMVGMSWFLDPKTGVHELGSLDLFNRFVLYPSALSQNGMVAGLGNDSHNEEKGFLWSLENGLESFDIERGTSIRGVNDKGQVTGEFDWDTGDRYPCHRAFFFSREHGFLNLGALGGYASRSYAINSYSQVVGKVTLKDEEHTAFIWDPAFGMRDLNALILQGNGWENLECATSINDSGYIVGYGIYCGELHNFLLIPKKS